MIPSRPAARLSAAAAVLLALLAACSSSKGKADQPARKPRAVTIFATAELKGTVEPCGCTADPLGDLARTARLVSEARASGGVLYIDGGSSLFTQPVLDESQKNQEALKARLIAGALTEPLSASAVGLGPYDLAMGPSAVSPPRMAANLAADAGVALEEPKVVTAGDIKVGLFGVLSVAAARAVGLAAGDPATAAKAAAQSLRERGAEVVIGIAHMTRKEAQTLAHATDGVDFLLYSQNLPGDAAQTQTEPDYVGETWLFGPADRGQVVSKLTITVRDQGEFADAIGEVRAEVELEELAETIPALEEEIARWEADPSSDEDFVAAKKKELEELRRRKIELEKNPVQAPDSGNYFTLGQIEINKTLPCHTAVVAAKQTYDKAAGQVNLEAAAGKKPPKPDKGQAGYVGIEECSFCHEEAVEFWNNTKHQQAWETLEVSDKQFNYDCIGCHVTGWDKPGGSTLTVNEPLRDVQCEVCHGPGSIHVDAVDKKGTIVLSPSQDTCIGCHNEEHSDTFDFEPYLRDVTGKGHAEKFRKALGDGPTGHELRSAALEAAGEIGKGCPK